MKRKRIIAMGFMGSCPIAGVIWQHLHYIIGLQRLGHEVYYIEDSARLPYNPQTFEVNNDFSYAAKLLQQLARTFHFSSRWSFCARYLPGFPTAGLPLTRIRELYRSADAILNICGTQEFNDDLLASERILYIESDPGVEQIKVDKGVATTIDYLKRHHALFTFGENVGTSRFPVPAHGLKWLPTRQPVVISLWQTRRAPAAASVFTSIANWSTSGLKDIEWHGENYLWSKSKEFLRFIAAPSAAGESFELATDIGEAKTRAKFVQNHWRFRLPHDLSIDRNTYRSYIRASKGEFTVAKDQYVRLNTAWFSDRSACYLAAGRPVITQETGFSSIYHGDGLFPFQSLEEISEATRRVRAEYKRYSNGALMLAHEVFDAEKVLRDLLARANI
ncbi:MAG: hypothetical protein JO354_04260 [Verrucomicrobia bacterium]|nr:hypothetical protein [Verrucomicrobiota bacterium]